MPLVSHFSYAMNPQVNSAGPKMLVNNLRKTISQLYKFLLGKFHLPSQQFDSIDNEIAEHLPNKALMLEAIENTTLDELKRLDYKITYDRHSLSEKYSRQDQLLRKLKRIRSELRLAQRKQLTGHTVLTSSSVTTLLLQKSSSSIETGPPPKFLKD